MKLLCKVWAARATKAHAAISVGVRDRLLPIPDGPPVLVDIGARGGLQRKWAMYAKVAPLNAILIEPDTAEANRLKQTFAVIQTALSDRTQRETLYITSEPSCSSLLPPSERGLRSDAAWRLHVIAQSSVTTARADEVFAAERLPPPNFLKIDTQGSELSILRGFGNLLDSVCAVELEAELIPLYEHQPLLGDVVAYFDTLGFALAAMRPNGHIDEGICDVNAYFLRRGGGRNERERRLLRTWRTVNRIPSGVEYTIQSG